MKSLILIALLSSALVTAGCDAGSSTESAGPSAPAAAAPSSPLPAGLKLAAAPDDAQDVAAVRGSVRDGQRIVVRGVVAGGGQPIAANRAILTLLDRSIKTCDQVEGDSCSTPWDACCEPTDVLTAHTLTVQVVDAEGRPLKASLSELDGVKPLARLTASGTASVTPDGNVLVNADGLFVEQP